MDQVDAAIIGFGAASKPLALDLADAGLTVAVIERSTRMYGGACVNTACLPSKMLVHAAAESAFEGGEFPARAERYEAVIDEKNEATARLRERSYRVLADNPRIEVIDGEASFVDATHLSVRTANGERQLEAARTFIDTGSVPALPDIPGADGKRVYTSESLLDVKILPERTVIVGAGYVGLEFASLFADFGADVTVLQGGEDFLPREDADMARAVRENFEQRGIKLMLGAQVKSLEDDVAQVLVIADVDGKEMRLPGDFALVATGRRPATMLAQYKGSANINDGRGAIVTDEHLRTTAPNIWAMGDVTEPQQFTYVSYDDYRIVMVEQSSDTVAQGVVISQDPPAGSEKLMDDQIIQITVSSGPSLVEMPDIIGFTQANASKKLDALGIQYKMVMVDNDGTMAAGCVASTDYKAGTKINTENVTVIVSIAGERDDTLVAQTGNAGESTPEPTPQPEE